MSQANQDKKNGRWTQAEKDKFVEGKFHKSI